MLPRARIRATISEKSTLMKRGSRSAARRWRNLLQFLPPIRPLAEGCLRLGPAYRIGKVLPVYAGEECHPRVPADGIDSWYGGHRCAVRTVTNDGQGIERARCALSIPPDHRCGTRVDRGGPRR